MKMSQKKKGGGNLCVIFNIELEDRFQPRERERERGYNVKLNSRKSHDINRLVGFLNPHLKIRLRN